MRVKVIQCGPPVNESEQKAINYLKTSLISIQGDDHWQLLTNLNFSATHRKQSDEIDIVAIGPPGVQVIEVKHWTASWVKRHLDLVELEADRVTNKARKIGTTLRRQIANLPRVDGAFLLTEATAKVQGIRDHDPVRGVPFYSLNDWRGAVVYDAPGVLTTKQIEVIARCLAPRNSALMNGTVKSVAGYTRLKLQTPQDERFHRIYKATHAHRREPVILHLYDLSAIDDKSAENKAEREWRSLNQLQQHSWAPRIVDSFQDVPGYTGEVKFFTITDPAAPSIRERSEDDSWDTQARIQFAHNTLQALNTLHKSGTDGAAIMHRNLTSDTVLVKHNNTPILTSFEHARIPSEMTIVSPFPSEVASPMVAPEVRSQGRAVADQRSDIYSLCASLTILFEYSEDENCTSAKDILASGKFEVPDLRSSLSDLGESFSKLLDGLRNGQSPIIPARFWSEDQVVKFGSHNYRIISRLGSGGVGTAFKVVKLSQDTQSDLGTYVAKVIRDEETGGKILKNYERVRPHLRHHALSAILEIAPEGEENNFGVLMTWIEGEPLSEYTGVLPILAEDLDLESDEALAIKWLRTACEALGILHDNRLVHGDISPRNIIVSGTDLVLTDYDCICEFDAQRVLPGTIMYSPTPQKENRNTLPTDDIYSLAASFFHVLFDKEPFQYGGALAKDRGLNWQGVPRDRYSILAAFFDRATHPDSKERFATVAEAYNALRQATNVPAPDVEGENRYKNEVPWLKSLLQSYPGSRWGNAETRGLDSEFASKTYVEADWEKALRRDILDRRISLVVLCGNAGDGKTALLQHLAQSLGLGQKRSEMRIVKGELDGGLILQMNLDGSASWEGSTADQILDDFLAPFKHGAPNQDIVHLLAINDGRLLEWIETSEECQDTPLAKALLGFLENDHETEDSHIRFINLNQRSLVGGVAWTDSRRNDKEIKTQFLDSLLDHLYGGENAVEIWSPCRTCLAQERCEVFRASNIFGPDELTSDKDLRDQARQRLFHALQAVHLRGETHVTVRELRATLIYVLFGLHYCRDYHALDGESSLPDPQIYSDRAFSPESFGRQGEVLRELERFDPALDSHPQVDRYLLRAVVNDDNQGLSQLEGFSLEQARRRAYFEMSEAEVESLTGDPQALNLAWGSHLKEYLALATYNSADQKEKLITSLCAGISRLESLPTQALNRSDDTVPLRISPRTPTETSFWVEKSVGCFRLEVDLPEGCKDMDKLHRRVFLIYRFKDGRDEKLSLGADLFHLLLELSEGYQLGDIATDDVFTHLSIFVQRLIQENHRQMFAWNAIQEDEIYNISIGTDDEESQPIQRIIITSSTKLGKKDAK
ncbi:MAG: NERD domain-containing protein [Gammaproteobacteria bacterium]|nr:NERD domain-containing protein [Gammaproteobacteria bacterium]